ncbi:MAG: septum site-determining protein MinC [Chloroflexi bacterium]|nr:septum site-determining protein MinC [Chloroflexota bacterium]
MSNNQVVQVSGRGINVDFIIDDVAPIEEVTKGLRQYLEDNRGLWSGGAISVNVGRRMNSAEQLNEFKQIIEKESGLTVTRFWCSPEVLEEASARARAIRMKATPPQPAQSPAAGAFPRATASVQPPPTQSPDSPAAAAFPRAAVAPPANQIPAPPPARPPQTPDVRPVRPAATGTKVRPPAPSPGHSSETAGSRPHGDQTVSRKPPVTLPESDDGLFSPSGIDYLESRRDTALFVKSTCRSGEIIRYPGDVVVLADVNPGAEIIADGDIAVFGCLRGFAHAGSQGNTKATIVALSLESPRIQIGPHVGVAPRPDQWLDPIVTGPTIAYVRRRSIHVAPFEGRFAKYGKGVVYEG